MIHISAPYKLLGRNPHPRYFGPLAFRDPFPLLALGPISLSLLKLGSHVKDFKLIIEVHLLEVLLLLKRVVSDRVYFLVFYIFFKLGFLLKILKTFNLFNLIRKSIWLRFINLHFYGDDFLIWDSVVLHNTVLSICLTNPRRLGVLLSIIILIFLVRTSMYLLRIIGYLPQIDVHFLRGLFVH